MAEYEGDGSYQRLITDIIGLSKNYIAQNYKEYNVKTSMDDLALQTVFPFFRSGRFEWSVGGTYDRITGGFYWENSRGSDKTATSLRYYSTSINSQVTYYKGYGNSVRCVANVVFLTCLC